MAERFVSFYEEALAGFAAWEDMDALSLFFAICKHVNAFGWCDPGDKLLGDLCGHRRDTTIPALLGRLQAADLIHVIETTVPFRQKPLRGFQVNPFVVRLRDENRPSAVADWFRYNPQTIDPNEKQTSVIIQGRNDHQPDQSQNQLENQSQNQNQNQHLNQRKSSGVAADQDFFEVEMQKQRQKQDNTQGEAQSAVTTRSEPTSQASAIPSSAAPRPSEPRSLQAYKTPLPHPTDEDVAMELVNLTGDLSRENARMLVDTYKFERVARAMLLYRHHVGTVKQPGRWIRAMLRKGTDELWKEQPFERHSLAGD